MIAFSQIMKFVIDNVAALKINFTSWLERERSRAQPTNLTTTRLGIVTLSFCLLTNVVQRFAGSLSIHSGQPFLVKGTFGLLSTTACLHLSNRIEDLVLPVRKPLLHFIPKGRMFRCLSHREIIDFLGVFLFMERKSFHTALPSSLLSKGLHARRNGKLSKIKPAEDEKQRDTIQIYGKSFGCHQCGSKQFFKNDEYFIADKIPPTSIAEKKNESWWRRALGMKVSLTRFNIFF